MLFILLTAGIDLLNFGNNPNDESGVFGGLSMIGGGLTSKLLNTSHLR